MFDRRANVDVATNVSALLNGLEGALGRKVTLFVTSPQPNIGTVLPLVAAVAKHECAGHEMEAVFDGRFLTAEGRSEIDTLLEAAASPVRA